MEQHDDAREGHHRLCARLGQYRPIRTCPKTYLRVDQFRGGGSFECKGRISPPDSATKTKAKEQAQRLVSVNGTRCALHIWAITYFRSDVLQFYWRDPPPLDGKQVNVTFNPDAWRYYYSQIIHAIVDTDERVAMQMSVGTFVAVDGLDLEVSIYPAIARFLFRGECAGARSRLSYSSTSSTPTNSLS